MNTEKSPIEAVSFKDKVEAIITQMTLSEKLGQLQQMDGGISKDDLPRLIGEGRVGSVLNEVDIDRVAMYQRIALEESRLGIPLLIGRDVIHGFRTLFPIPLAQSASWNPEIAREGASIASKEASVFGINWTFAPMIDVSRDPRWGRIAESPGEDAFLTSRMGEAMVKGFQGNGVYSDGNLAACAKHFAAYGMAEGGRDYNTAMVNERQLREVYLRPFQAAIDAGVLTFMTSFNDVDDIPASGSEFLLRKVLKGEWDYDGMVVSDGASSIERIKHGYCENEGEAAFRAMRAGVDMEMVSTAYTGHLESLLEEGRVDMSLVDDAVRRILLTKFRLGLFENPYPLSHNRELILSPPHLESAKQAAIESIVLLKNKDNLLPISDQVNSIAVIGPLANAPHDQMGTWSFDGVKGDSVTPLKALQDAYADGVSINYAPGLDISRTKDQAGFGAAIEAAQQSEVILYFVGEEAILSGEAHSRAHLNLPGAQKELLEELAKTGKPIVMIVMAGRPVILTDLLPKVDAVLYAWHGGTMAGPAIADVLTNKANPSGKLPITFPTAVGQIPMYHSHKNTGRPASFSTWTPMYNIPKEAPQTSLGNTSHYLDEGFLPLFPFGFGLSYTNFEYHNLNIDKGQLNKNESLVASITVKNTGAYDGYEVVQLYIQDLFGSVIRPVRELKGFQKVLIKAGEEKTIQFEITVEDLKFFSAGMDFTAEPGDFKLWIGPHSASDEFVAFSLVE